MTKFIISKENAGQRIDKFLLENYPDFSRAYIQKQIKSGAVLVNGEIKKPSYILKETDKIEADILPPEKISLEPDSSIKFKVIYEDDDVLVIDKPAGLTVHPSESQKSGTLVNGILARYPLLKEVGDDPTRPSIVHRLDKDTSGLMVVAKNNSAFEFLKKQFQEGKVEKKYLALVVGKMEQKEGEISTFIARSSSDPTKQKVTQKEGKNAITFLKVLEEYPGFSLIEAMPKTGRLHQIRVHLAWIGNPVAGDKKYGPKNKPLPLGLKRHFLHATELKITLPSDQRKLFSSPLPSDLESILEVLKKS
ncbi:MAG: RluA family pseudouridine synthase [Candidatus Portnoybacteria bacterium]|nr:RluA family pseudouridine synthase [Candidatus Portnoybacteria bacterium]